ncbi:MULTISPECIES: hypothetical protein [Eisenbergiella]|uniref:Uncharacterized protein n=1 Tax=Eisenbergiella porci TaxID=2652274 RepID=A0A6N7W4M8_9FIRM|nr:MULTISPECIES: hypothetical protein [Eisenbergiella]MDY2654514.1 hypothetical protein [Eisenbergiella porci]MSS89512.1 hypothetical protein [Eisenbergiella porci]
MDYLGIRHQALLDMADWCEKGIAPVPSTNYRVNDGQIEIPAGAAGCSLWRMLMPMEKNVLP